MVQRDRGQYLTGAGLARLEKAILSWQDTAERKCTQEKLKELSGGLDLKTISNIRRGKAGADLGSLQRLFAGLGLTLSEFDHYIPSSFRSQVEPSRPQMEFDHDDVVNFDCDFVGRDRAICDLNDLVKQGHKIIVIHAKGGVGKTALARQYFKAQGFDKILNLRMAREIQDIISVEAVIEEWLLRNFEEEPGREFGVTLSRLDRKLQDPSLRIGILIDDLEPVLDSSGRFVSGHRRYVELLRVLGGGDTLSLTLITSRERLGESAVSVHHYPLQNLDIRAWRVRLDIRQVRIDDSALTEIHHAYGGNAKAMEILIGAILQDYQGDLANYWRVNQRDLLVERELEDLVLGQVNRLSVQAPDAYKLLCRMSCYRYQDIPVVPIEGLLCLLWDIEENKKSRILRQLEDRSLVDHKDGNYWLHPVIRWELRDRLKNSEDWEISNQKAACFWSKNIEKIKNIKDAITALEAYHYYVAIHDFDAASGVIARERIIKPNRNEALGTAFYRLGLLQQMKLRILKIIDEVRLEENIAILSNILGNLYWLTGDTRNAVRCHERSGQASDLSLRKGVLSGYMEKRLERLSVVCFFNVGLCKIDTWELEEALQVFNKIYVAGISREKCNDAEFMQSTGSCFCLAFLNSVIGNEVEAKFWIEKFNPDASYGIWSEGYSYLFLGLAYKNLGDINNASKM